jgi:hypothetical protein
MKYFLFCLLTISNSLFSQTYQSSCTPTDDMVAAYRHDVFRLALAHVTEIQSPYKDSVEIPAPYQDSIAKAIYAIQNMPWTPLKDTIMNMFGFRNFNPTIQYEADSLHILNGIARSVGQNVGGTWISYRLRTLYLNVSSSANFYNDWISGNYYNTSNTAINFLVQRYNLKVMPSSNPTGNFVITSPAPLNIIVLRGRFAAITGVQAPGADNNYVGDGNSIIVSYDPDGIILRYRNGCGDCPAGCTYATTWTFKVSTNTNCEVQYLGRIPVADGETAFQRVCSRGIVLPLSFLSTNGSIKNNLATIDWKTTAEERLRRYEIERSEDGVQFTTVGSVQPKTNSTNIKNYSWTDNKILKGTAYYRIKSISLTGSIQFSNIIKLSSENSIPNLLIFPNPAINKSMNLHITNAAGRYTLNIYNFAGLKIYSQSIAVTSASFATTIKLQAGLPKGSYQVVIQNDKQHFRNLVQLQ